jgi:hypothetical protein
VRVAATAGLLLYLVSFIVFGLYPLTYFGYVGVLLALALFGGGIVALDNLFFENKSSLLERYGALLIRVCYGFGLVYTAVSVKFLHPGLPMTVVQEYHLTQFHLLFPSDPLLVVFGAALAETTIGILIILGLRLRLTILISLFYLTLSLLFFREMLWPHLILFGISLGLLVNKNEVSLDTFLKNRLYRQRS